MAWQEWLELEAAKSEGGGDGDGDGGGEEKVPALLQMAASQIQHDESLTEVCVYFVCVDARDISCALYNLPSQEGERFVLCSQGGVICITRQILLLHDCYTSMFVRTGKRALAPRGMFAVGKIHKTCVSSISTPKRYTRKPRQQSSMNRFRDKYGTIACVCTLFRGVIRTCLHLPCP